MILDTKNHPRHQQSNMKTYEEAEQPGGTKKKERSVPRKMTPARLENIALHHLDRFSTSSENLKRVLTRRVLKSARHHNTDQEQCAAWIDTLIERYQECGLLDDPAYARAQVNSHNRRGKSVRAIRALLRQKGVTAADIDLAIEGLAENHPDPDLAAANAYARRRRLGPYRTREVDDKAREKELAALARAGFSYGIARRIVAAETVEEIDQDG